MEPIRSLRNRAVVEAGRLHQVRERRNRSRTLIEGPHALSEAIGAGMDIEATFALVDDPHYGEWPAVSAVSEAVMGKLAGTATPRGPVAVMHIPPWDPVPSNDVVVPVEVGDPGNLGTIIRTAAAFGLGVVIGPGTADPWSPKVLRAGAGGHFQTSLSHVEGPLAFSSHRLAASVVSGGVAPEHLDEGPWAFLIGGEAHGLDSAWVGAADVKVTIPMPGGSESLNAAMAAAILSYSRIVGS